MVLDPFAGTGTVLAVATGHGRDATGIDLDESNAQLALDRVGPLFLEIVGDTTPKSTTRHNPTGSPRYRVGYHGTQKRNYGDPEDG